MSSKDKKDKTVVTKIESTSIQFKKASQINFGNDKDGELRDLLKMTDKVG